MGPARLRRVLGRTALAVGVALFLPYAVGPFYAFPDPVPFAGPLLHNPYAGWTGAARRANLHAHGAAWAGVTSGAQPSDTVVRRYRELGYDVAGVSNYMDIAAHRGVHTLPLYEHGINLGKYHQLAIGAREVDWFDFPLWQSLSHRQFVIDRVGARAALVSLNHPDSRDAYGNHALRYLTGYDMIELANGPFTAEALWDEALSAGHPAWALANDDSHDVTDVRRTAVSWNMIGTASTGEADILTALRAGRFYAVLRTGAITAANDTRLRHVDVVDGTVRVRLDGLPARVTFIGQNGVVKKEVQATTTADYTVAPEDTYIRAVVRAPQTTLFLNPVFRWDGVHLHPARAWVHRGWTWGYRGVLLAVAAFVLARLVRRSRRPARPA